MVSEQDDEIVGKLDGIRRDRQKFLCLNDNMNHSDPKSEYTKQALHDLYEVFLFFLSLLFYQVKFCYYFRRFFLFLPHLNYLLELKILHFILMNCWKFVKVTKLSQWFGTFSFSLIRFINHTLFIENTVVHCYTSHRSISHFSLSSCGTSNSRISSHSRIVILFTFAFLDE